MRADGPAGERWASALLMSALCAETAHATASEDDDKIDLKLSFEHAFVDDARITAHCQIKSGPSWLSCATPKAFHLKSIPQKTISALRAGTRPSLLVWVPPPPREGAFWYAFGIRRRDDTPLVIPRWHSTSPALRYDLTRIFEHCTPSRRANRLDVSAGPVDPKSAKKAYQAMKGTYAHPLAGKLRVSRFGWRHITRQSKSSVRRAESFRLIPYLPNFLVCTPDRFSTVSGGIIVEGSMAFRRSWIWCWYNNALRISDMPHRLLVRFREEVIFPRDWNKRPLAVRDIRQVAVLESWWAKPERT